MRVAGERMVLEPPFPIDVVRTLSPFRCGPRDPSCRIEGWCVTRAIRTRSGPATLRFEPLGEHISVTAWGAGSEVALRAAPAMLGFEDDDQDFVAHHEVIRRAHQRYRSARVGRGGALVSTLVSTILEQKVTSAEAHASWAALVWRHGEPAPGPVPVRLAPTADALAEMPYTTWHPLGVERRRAETVRRVCRRAQRLTALEHESPAEARRVLEHFAGVGPWTSGLVTWHALGDPDAMVPGDFHYPHVVSYTLTGKRRGTDAEMLELLEPYRGHRARALRLVLLGGASPPRRAPRARRRAFAAY
jgi:3-methyladenine DNA glycosylase/8-oxoguanine DNA glycosylase